jgi:hypothetical protein
MLPKLAPKATSISRPHVCAFLTLLGAGRRCGACSAHSVICYAVGRQLPAALDPVAKVQKVRNERPQASCLLLQPFDLLSLFGRTLGFSPTRQLVIIHGQRFQDSAIDRLGRLDRLPIE